MSPPDRAILRDDDAPPAGGNLVTLRLRPASRATSTPEAPRSALGLRGGDVIDLVTPARADRADRLVRRAAAAARRGATSDELVPLFEEALALNPKHLIGRLRLGVLHAEAGQLDDAVTCWARVVALEPRLPEGHYNLGLVAFQRGDYPGAVQHFGRALHWDATFARAYLALAQALHQLGQRESMIDPLEKFLRVAPRRDPARASARATIKAIAGG